MNRLELFIKLFCYFVCTFMHLMETQKIQIVFHLYIIIILYKLNEGLNTHKNVSFAKCLQYEPGHAMAMLQSVTLTW